ncbi:MAG: FAD-dependent oxidoreductase [Actinomycetota bacterium]
MERVDVCIVGGGVTGLAAAWRLGLMDVETLLLERFELDHTRGSSHGATRIFRFAYPDPLYVRMAQQALPMWRELEAQSGENLLKLTGGIDVGDPKVVQAVAVAMESCGAEVERMPNTRRRAPWLHVDGPGLFSPHTGVLAAARTLSVLAGAARKAGVEIREQTTVTGLEMDVDGVTIRTAAGDVRARRCIVAAGAWAAGLLEPVGITLPVHVTREQVFYHQPDVEIMPFIHYGAITRYAVPAFAGAAGVKVAEHMTGEHTSGDGRSFEMDPEGSARVAAFVGDALPGLDPDPVAFETCLYTVTSDHDFIIEPRGPLIIASACSGHGFKFGPLLGESLARLATDRPPPFPLDRLALERFGL